MEAYRIKTVAQKDGALILNHLPFEAGIPIEVIILAEPVMPVPANRYPLRGKPVVYLEPMEPVAESEWSAMQ